MISKSGAYIVKKNLTIRSVQPSPPSPVCITVNANYVSIDLGGYTIDCGDSHSGFGEGIVAAGAGLLLRNGLITKCAKAIDVGSTSVLIDHLLVDSNEDGVFVSSAGNSVIDSVSNNNVAVAQSMGVGILLQCPSVAVGNTPAGNTADLILSGPASCASWHNLTGP
jgi:hypothetical protein